MPTAVSAKEKLLVSVLTIPKKIGTNSADEVAGTVDQPIAAQSSEQAVLLQDVRGVVLGDQHGRQGNDRL